MADDLDPAVLGFAGSRTRLLTLAVLANADGSLTGYRVAKIAGLPPIKVYQELRRAQAVGLVQRPPGETGYQLTDAELRRFLQRRVRIRWDDEWDAARRGWGRETPRLLSAGLDATRRRIRENPNYLRPRNWKPPPAARGWGREIRRAPSKDIVLRRAGRRTSAREDWAG